MKQLRNLILLFAAAMAFTACGGGDDDYEGSETDTDRSGNANRNIVTTEKAAGRLEVPRLKGDKSILLVYRAGDDNKYDKDRVNYCVEWDCDRKSQRWSCYQMHKGYNGNYNRVVGPGIYWFDRQLPDGSYWEQDYFKKSGFDHGHICPSADRTYSYDANYQTFYLTNMQPQYRKFNGFSDTSSDQGLWLRLEKRLRSWSPTNSTDTLYVCKGGTIDRESDIIKRIEDKLIVPKYFFVALLMKNKQGYKAIGFYMEQKNEWATNANLADYAMSIDELEQKTGIDFFCNLPDDIENDRERTMSTKAWGL